MNANELFELQHNNEWMMRVIPENLEQYSLNEIKKQLTKDENTINTLIVEIIRLEEISKQRAATQE